MSPHTPWSKLFCEELCNYKGSLLKKYVYCYLPNLKLTSRFDILRLDLSQSSFRAAQNIAHILDDRSIDYFRGLLSPIVYILFS